MEPSAELLYPDVHLLAQPGTKPNEDWIGPGPPLTNFTGWLEKLSGFGHVNLVKAALGASLVALPKWEEFYRKEKETALDSLLEGAPPDKQLEYVEEWIENPSDYHLSMVRSSIDETKQLYWFHEEYEDVWFDRPGMWAVEACEFCALTLVYGFEDIFHSGETAADQAIVCAVCSLNSMRTSAENVDTSLFEKIVVSIRKQFEKK